MTRIAVLLGRCRRGAALPEYIVLLTILGAAAWLSIGVFGKNVTEIYDDAASALSPAETGTVSDPGGETPADVPSIDLVQQALPHGMRDQVYSYDMKNLVEVSGGIQKADLDWRVSYYSLPAGLALADSTGIVSGTPTEAQNLYFTIEAETVFEGERYFDNELYTLNITGEVYELVDIAASASFACGITKATSVVCWGDESYGELGHDDGDTRTSTTIRDAVEVDGLQSGVTDLTVGDSFACAVQAGAARCWGSNKDGQMGLDPSNGSYAPWSFEISGLASGVTAIDAGETHACAVKSSEVFCWGDNSNGQIGNGATTGYYDPPVTPAYKVGVTGATNVAAGSDHSCASFASGPVKCWGANRNGQLGDGSSADRQLAPVAVAGTDGAELISAANVNTCALVGGAAKCWGNDELGQVGDGPEPDFENFDRFSGLKVATPATVSGLQTGVTDIDVGRHHACAVQNGTAKCWGGNQDYQLAAESPRQHGFFPEPRSVIDMGSGVQAIAAGAAYSCAIQGDTFKCWGGVAGGDTTGVPGCTYPPCDGQSVTINLSGATLPDGEVDYWYEHDLTQYLDYTGTIVADEIEWNVVAGDLPDGLLFDDYGSDAGRIIDTPSAKEEATFTVEVSADGVSDTAEYHLKIRPGPCYSWQPCYPRTDSVTLTGDALPKGEVGAPYAFDMKTRAEVTGAIFRSDLEWSLTNDALPDTLSIDAETGIISGTPAVSATYTPEIEASAQGESDTRAYTMQVDASGGGAPPGDSGDDGGDDGGEDTPGINFVCTPNDWVWDPYKKVWIVPGWVFFAENIGLPYDPNNVQEADIHGFEYPRYDTIDPYNHPIIDHFGDYSGYHGFLTVAPKYHLYDFSERCYRGEILAPDEGPGVFRCDPTK